MDDTRTERLNDLIRLDNEAVRAYTRAIDDVDFEEARNRLVNFREDHRRHIEVLAGEVRALGGLAPELTREEPSFLVEGLSAVRSTVGTEQALRTLRLNELSTNHAYAEAVRAEGPGELLDVLEEFLEDERRHLRYLETALRQQPWKYWVRKAG